MKVSIIADIPVALKTLLPQDHIVGKLSEVQLEQTDILITDHPNLTYVDSFNISQNQDIFSAHMTDYNRETYAANLYVDTDQIATTNFANPFATILLGLKYTVISDQIKERRPEKTSPPSNITTILLALGGADPGQLTEIFTQSFDWKKNNINLTIIAGPAWNTKRLEEFTSIAPPHCQILSNPNNLSSLILTSDLIITLGGIIAFEAMCLGRPVAALNWQHMGVYVSTFAQQGLLVDLGKTPNDWKKKLPQLINNKNKLKQLAETGFQTIDGKAVERLTTAILHSYQLTL